MPFKNEKKWVPPGRDKRGDAEIGNTAAWAVVERAKNAGIAIVSGWRRDKSVGAVANELRCHPSVNEIIRTLDEKIREKKGK